MTTELRKRIVLTLLLLGVSRILYAIPLPGLNLSSLSRLLESSGSSYFFFPVDVRYTIGSLGIAPFLAASFIVVLYFYFRKRKLLDDREFPFNFYTLILTGVIALLQGYGISVFLESVPALEGGALLVSRSGWSFRLLTMISIAAGSYLFVWIATLITQNGLGNGVCLLIFAGLVTQLPNHILDLFQRSRSQTSETSEDAFVQFLVLLLAAIVLIMVVFALVLAKRPLTVKSRDRDDETAWAPSLHLNGVGTSGAYFGRVLFFLMSTLLTITAPILSDSLFEKAYAALQVGGPGYWGIFAVATFFGTYFFTALAYNPGGLQNILKKYSASSNDLVPAIDTNDFDKRLAIRTLPLAVVAPVMFVFLGWFTFEFSLQGLFTLDLFVITAIALHTHRQFRLHRQMAGPDEDDHDLACEHCERGVAEEDRFCRRCGVLFEEDVKCDEHAETRAKAQCVICYKKLCGACAILNNGRFTCEEHSYVEIIENWATACTANTQLEADFIAHCLKRSGGSALVLSNSVEPMYGTLGLFAINPVTPFFVYRELAGGCIRVMVPIEQWLTSQEGIPEALEEAPSE